MYNGFAVNYFAENFCRKEKSPIFALPNRKKTNKIDRHEKDISALATEEGQQTRVPRADVDAERPPRTGCPPCQRTQKTDRLRRSSRTHSLIRSRKERKGSAKQKATLSGGLFLLATAGFSSSFHYLCSKPILYRLCR